MEWDGLVLMGFEFIIFLLLTRIIMLRRFILYYIYYEIKNKFKEELT